MMDLLTLNIPIGYTIQQKVYVYKPDAAEEEITGLDLIRLLY
jgi:hypothetical protein